MKQIYHILAMVLFVTGALIISCTKVETTSEDNPEVTSEPQTVHFTATLAPKGESPVTKAITTGTEGGKEILNVAWTVGEKIEVKYNKGQTTAEVTAVDPITGTATISATLDGPKDGSPVAFIYPATLASDSYMGDFFDVSKLLNQHGNLTGANGISTLYDYATGSGTLSVSAGTAVVSSKVTMTNQVCICKFRFSLDNGSGMGGYVEQAFDNLKIYDGNGYVYTITSDRPHEFVGGMTRSFNNTDDIYVAMLPVSSKTVIFHYEQPVIGGKANYMKVAPNTMLTAGKFYRSLNLTLTKEDYNGSYNDFKDLSAGSITAADGDCIYQSNSAVTSNTITIPDGITVTLAGVNISSSGSAGIICNSSANIILAGTNTVTALDYYPGIQAGGSGTTLTISGNGGLTVRGGGYSAGIGGGDRMNCGNIIIKRGTITATSGYDGAGIGSGSVAHCGDITISGGTVNAATVSNHGAGIGCGDCGQCGNITITGGCVTASKGSNAPYSIGFSNGLSPFLSICGTVTIGGTVYYDGSNFLNGGDSYLATSPLIYP